MVLTKAGCHKKHTYNNTQIGCSLTWMNYNSCADYQKYIFNSISKKIIFESGMLTFQRGKRKE
jgi:hypothetical protein